MGMKLLAAKVPADLIEKIKIDAEADDRSMSYVLRKILMQHYAGKGK